MKRYNDYFTLLFVTFLTLFSFFHMSTIVDVSHDVITIVFKNLLPSLLPFMILVSLCLNLGILDILAYFLQIPFYNLFSLTPMMSSLYFVSFFCGYPTNVKIIKEAYELNYIDLDELPGPIVKTEDELIKAIKNAESDRSFDEKYKAFNAKFNYLDDGKAAQRVTEAIIEE